MSRHLRNVLLLCVLFVCPLIARAQHTVSGIVTDRTSGQPIPGVNVQILNTTTGTQTSPTGHYSIAVPAGSTLVFSSIGMATQLVPITEATTYNIALSVGETSLSEVVVTSQGISREKRSLGYAVSTINKEAIGQNVSPINALQGKVAGLNISSNNSAGASSRIVLRGPTSFNGSNQPVFIVDGIPVSNANMRNADYLNNQVDYGNRGNDINPNDIESITVLKGPGAAALYGSIASNGAIVITTKRGKKNSPAAVTFSSAYQLSNPLKLPDFQNEFGEGNLDGIVDDRRENFSWGEAFDGKERPFGQIINGKQRLKKYEAIPDNIKDFFNTGQLFNNDLTLSGGGDKATYFLSLGSLNSKGIVPTNSYDKYSIRFNGSSDFSPKFSSSVSLAYTNIRSKPVLSGQTNSIYASIFQQPRDMPIVDFQDLKNPFNGTFTGDDGTDYYGYYGAYTKNPYFLLQNYKNSNLVDRVAGSFSLVYKPLKGLAITERLGADSYSDRRYQKNAKYSYVPFDPFYAGNNWADNGAYSEITDNYTQINQDLIVSYETPIIKDLNVKLLGGNNIRTVQDNVLSAATNASAGLILPGFYNLSNSNGPTDDGNALTQTRLYGFYGEVDLDYKNTFFLGATGRNDVTSTLPVANNSYFYPSVNAAIVLSEFYKNTPIADVVSFAKLRATYAKVGADASAYLLKTTYSATDISGDFGEIKFPLNVQGNTIPGFTTNNRIGNSALKPEFTTSKEVGLELSFFKDLINAEVTYYETKSTNQIVNVPISPSSGFSLITMNAGEMRNNGLEVTFRARPINSASGFRWDIYGTYSKVNNKVTSTPSDNGTISLGGGLTVMGEVAAKGKPYGTFYGTGLVKDSATGKTVIDAVTGLPLNNATNFYGTYLPNYQASLGTDLSYKGFTLKVLFDTKQGGVFYSDTKSLIDFGGYAKETAKNGRKDYVFPNSVYKDGSGKIVPNTNITFHPYTYYTSIIPAGENLIDASYIKLREASLSYALPLSLMKRTPFKGLSLTAYGNNLFIWTPKSNQFADPELNSQGASNVQGFEFLSNMSQRNYGVKLNVSF